MKFRYLGIMILITVALVACKDNSTTMDLLDERVESIYVSQSKGLGGINEDYLHAFHGNKDMHEVERIIKNARIQKHASQNTEPMYDVMIEYQSNSGALPTHGLHVWVGDLGEPSTFMYIGSTDEYKTTEADTEVLREILKDD